MRRSLAAVCASTVLLLGLALIKRAVDDRRQTHSEGIQAGRFYALDVQSELSEFEIPFEEDTRYVLIVGCLGSPADSHRITLVAEDLRDDGPPPGTERESNRRIAQRIPARPVRPLQIPSPNVTAPLAQCRRVSPKPAGTAVAAKPPDTASNASETRTAASPKPNAHFQDHSDRDFFLHVTDGDLDDARHYARVSGRAVAEGQQVRVFLDRQVAATESARRQAQEIVDILEVEVMPQLRESLGTYHDVDRDGRFSVLLTPWLDRLQGGRTSLGGFVRSSDFRAVAPRPFSNRCDMLYLNSNLQPGVHLRDLIAHEFTHAVCFSECLRSEHEGRPLADEEDWLNEAIAHLSERNWTNLDYRISRFLNDPGRYPLVVPDYYRSGLWRSHGCRGATYLFLRWCADQYGADLLSQLVENPARGVRNIESTTGAEFAELFRHWSIALFKSGMHSGVSRTLTRSATASSILQPPRATAYLCSDDPTGNFTSVELREQIAHWGLAGPRPQLWDVRGGRLALDVQGTTASYVELRASRGPATFRIRVQGTPGANQQLSLVRLPQDWPRLRLDTRWLKTPTALDSQSLGHPEQNRLQVRVVTENFSVFPAGAAVAGQTPTGQIERIACEQNSGEVKQSECFTSNRLRSCHIPELAATEFDEHDGSTGPAASRRPSFEAASRGRSARLETYVLPIARVAENPGPLIIKVVATDARGRRAVAWSSLDWPEPAVFGPDVAKTTTSSRR